MIKRTNWEYLISTERGELPRLGMEGWELVSVTAAADGQETFYYKRPAPSVSERITLEQRDRALQKEEHAL